METKKKSGSELREKSKVIGVRVSDIEHFEIEMKALEVGLSVPSFIRKTVLEEFATTKPRKAPPSLDRKLLSQLLGQLGKIGSNINQIAHRLNEGGSVAAPRITAAVDDFELLRDEIFKALKALDYDHQRKVQSAGSTGGKVSS